MPHLDRHLCYDACTMSSTCETCRQPTASVECPLCENALCEDCVMSPPPGAFVLLPAIPADLAHLGYCRFCFDERVDPPLQEYLEQVERAKEVFIFFKTQRKEIPLIRRSKELMKVAECPDRDETILRLAFMSAQKGFNAVVETDVKWEKRRNHAHHKTMWEGSGVPAMIDAERLARQDRANAIYR